jgi:flagellar basal-body rod modification protein FlgD
MTTPISLAVPAAAPPSATSTTSTASKSSSDPLAQQQTFLQLLCAQIQNQDPMDPTQDPTQYVTQLAEFSSLEQLTAIHSDLDTLSGAATQAGTGGATSTQESS